MKKAFVSILLLASTSAFGYFGDTMKTLKGDGKWNDTEGNGGKYKVHVTISKESPETTSFIESYAFGSDTKTHTFKLVKTSELTFDVMSEDTKIGDGYCVDDLRLAHKDCHMSYSADDHRGDHHASINSLTGEVKRSGSCSEGAKKIIWRDTLRKAL